MGGRPRCPPVGTTAATSSPINSTNAATAQPVTTVALRRGMDAKANVTTNAWKTAPYHQPPPITMNIAVRNATSPQYAMVWSTSAAFASRTRPSSARYSRAAPIQRPYTTKLDVDASDPNSRNSAAAIRNVARSQIRRVLAIDARLTASDCDLRIDVVETDPKQIGRASCRE